MQSAFGTLQRYNDPLLYNSLLGEYKTPFGAVEAGKRVEILFPVRQDIGANSVQIVLRGADFEEKYSLGYDGTFAGYDNFKGGFCVSRAGTYFYRFELMAQGTVLFAGKDTNSQAISGDWLPEWELTVYEAGYTTPSAIKGGVVYHIFADRFNKSGNMPQPLHGVKKKWHEELTIVDPDGVYRANDFYGGNLKGITEKLDYLHKLGVTHIYLSPVFESSSNHRYDVADYTKIDRLLGDEGDFKNLISEAKTRGIDIILDGVFNHTGADSIYFNKFGHYDSIGAYKSDKSPYHDWYTFSSFPDEYDCWWGITVVPTVKRNSKGYQEFIAGAGGVIEKWQRLGVAGWRLDVVDELSSDFVEKIRVRVKEIDPQGIVIGEVWEDASRKYSYSEERQYFLGKQLDGVMNYVFKDAILSYCMHGGAESFINKVNAIIENYPKQSLDTSMTLVDSHDTFRAINALSGAESERLTKAERLGCRLYGYQYEQGKARLKAASALQYFLPGVPSLYYGDEIGMEGFEDPINRRPFTWDKMDKELLEHYRLLGNLRKNYRVNFVGSTILTCFNDMIKIDREGLRLIVNAGENKGLDKEYTDLISGKKISSLNKNEFIITLD